MRAGLTVFGVCLLISTVFAVQQYRAFKTDLVATQDLMLGLLYFMEAHAGRLPDSRDEFLASPFVEPLEDGAIRVVPPAETRYNQAAHGYPVRDLDRFRILWGRDLTNLKLTEYGRVVDAEDQAVELIRWPSSGESGKVYSRILLAESARLRAAASPPDDN